MANPERRLMFEVASEIGQSVAWVGDNVSSQELIEWAALFKLRAWEHQHGQPAVM